ncbi:hypothetical protein RGF97_13950 [Streptomyces roseicoloratus]|uniref:DUF11 domain-containing protein n=1 Tax=Streptomyces roseicoloratus TaxID=2508722 RepID=A0ABY9RW50_9ACTN|nr:hypothetical protein [Streptomyces roseicoloratus]WMX45736.1 hypothetical protein RGF97_13950 [Streptomyces roseicoloratus]
MTNRSVSDPTTGTVTLTDVLPQGLTVNSTHSHASWDCDVSLSSVTCTNDTVVQPFQSYPLLELNVNVAEDAPCTVTNTVTLSGGGSDAASASDPTTITGGDCDTPAPSPTRATDRSCRSTSAASSRCSTTSPPTTTSTAPARPTPAAGSPERPFSDMHTVTVASP